MKIIVLADDSDLPKLALALLTIHDELLKDAKVADNVMRSVSYGNDISIGWSGSRDLDFLSELTKAGYEFERCSTAVEDIQPRGWIQRERGLSVTIYRAYAEDRDNNGLVVLERGNCRRCGASR